MIVSPPRVRPNFGHLRSAAAGQWITILSAAGLPASILDGRGHACPRCGGSDRFAAWPDVNVRGAVHCRHCFTRGSSPRPGDGIATLAWLHGQTIGQAAEELHDSLLGGSSTGRSDGPWSLPSPTGFVWPAAEDRGIDPAVRQQLQNIAQRCASAMRRSWLVRLSDLLGVSVDALVTLGVGWDAEFDATTWPMRDHDGSIVGIRMRSIDGQKWSIARSMAGLFTPSRPRRSCRRLFIVEGATDTAAALSIGLPVVGLPSAGSTTRFLRPWIDRLGPAEIIIIADNDPVGIEAAHRVCHRVIEDGHGAAVLCPPPGVKDLRGWIAVGNGGGATAAMIDALADGCHIRRQRRLF